MNMHGHGMPVFVGASYQRGHGLGGVMKNMMRQATPMLQRAGKHALKSGIKSLLNDIAGSSKTKVQSRRIDMATKKNMTQTGHGQMKLKKNKKRRNPKKSTKKASNDSSKGYVKDIFGYK